MRGTWGRGRLLGDIGAMATPWPRHPPAPSPCPCPGWENTAQRLRRRVPLTFVGDTEARGVLLPRPGGVRLRQQGAEQEGSQRQPAATGSPRPRHRAAAVLPPSAARGERLGKCRGRPWGGTRELPCTQARFWKPPRPLPLPIPGAPRTSRPRSLPPVCPGGAGGRAGCSQVRTVRHFLSCSWMSCIAAALITTLLLCFQLF